MKQPTSVETFEVFEKDLWAPYLAVSALRSDMSEPQSPDEKSIHELLTEYCYCYDAGNIDRVLALFTDDAIISNASGIHRGMDEIRSNYIDFVAKRKFGFHFVTNMTIRLAESRQQAVSTSYLVTLNVKNDGQLALVAGSYIDRFRKTGDIWKFSERRITADIRTTLDSD